MCRFVVYQGRPVILADVLLNTENSLIHQSKNAKKRRKPVNGDGFGIGWYPIGEDPEPGVFVGVEPAWASCNLKQLCQKVPSKLFFAHIRDATEGMPIGQSNCHPFYRNKLLWMHNGKINGFDQVKRTIINHVSDKALNTIQGNTDSEYAFAVFQTFLEDEQDHSLDAMVSSLSQTIAFIAALVSDMPQPSYLNFAVSNGECSIATRYCNKPDVQAASLFYAQGELILSTEDEFRIKAGKGPAESIIIASEPLTRFKSDWIKLERNQMVVVDSKKRIAITDLD